MPTPIVIPVPIREDVVVQVQLPRDLTVPEAEKVARTIIALAQARPTDGH
jgi:hypothetical protein